MDRKEFEQVCGNLKSSRETACFLMKTIFFMKKAGKKLFVIKKFISLHPRKEEKIEF
jgi:hypothetical protein